MVLVISKLCTLYLKFRTPNRRRIGILTRKNKHDTLDIQRTRLNISFDMEHC